MLFGWGVGRLFFCWCSGAAFWTASERNGRPKKTRGCASRLTWTQAPAVRRPRQHTALVGGARRRGARRHRHPRRLAPTPCHDRPRSPLLAAAGGGGGRRRRAAAGGGGRRRLARLAARQATAAAKPAALAIPCGPARQRAARAGNLMAELWARVVATRAGGDAIGECGDGAKKEEKGVDSCCFLPSATCVYPIERHASNSHQATASTPARAPAGSPSLRLRCGGARNVSLSLSPVWALGERGGRERRAGRQELGARAPPGGSMDWSRAGSSADSVDSMRTCWALGFLAGGGLQAALEDLLGRRSGGAALRDSAGVGGRRRQARAQGAVIVCLPLSL